MEWEPNRKELVYALADTHRAKIAQYQENDRECGTLYWPAGPTFTTWADTEDEVLDNLAEEMFRVSHEVRKAMLQEEDARAKVHPSRSYHGREWPWKSFHD